MGPEIDSIDLIQIRCSTSKRGTLWVNVFKEIGGNWQQKLKKTKTSSSILFITSDCIDQVDLGVISKFKNALRK